MAADVKAPRIVRDITNMEEAARAAGNRAKLRPRYAKRDATVAGAL